MPGIDKIVDGWRGIVASRRPSPVLDTPRAGTYTPSLALEGACRLGEVNAKS